MHGRRTKRVRSGLVVAGQMRRDSWMAPFFARPTAGSAEYVDLNNSHMMRFGAVGVGTAQRVRIHPDFGPGR